MSEPNLTRGDADARVETTTAPRVTKQAIDEKIVGVEYTRGGYNPNLTICVINMRNGFSFVGKSAPASSENFDEEVGKRYAYDDAYKQIWSHEGYALRESLHGEGR